MVHMLNIAAATRATERTQMLRPRCQWWKSSEMAMVIFWLLPLHTSIFLYLSVYLYIYVYIIYIYLSIYLSIYLQKLYLYLRLEVDTPAVPPTPTSCFWPPGQVLWRSGLALRYQHRRPPSRHRTNGGFHKWGKPQIDGLYWKYQSEMDDDWGYPHDSGNLAI